MPRHTILLLAILLTSGCDRSSVQFVEIQAEQNRRLAELQTQVHAQQAELHRQRDRLEQERRQIAGQRDHAPLVADSIRSLALLLACLAPLLLAARLLDRRHTEPGTDSIADAILTDVNGSSPSGVTSALLPRPEPSAPRLTDSSTPSSKKTS